MDNPLKDAQGRFVVASCAGPGAGLDPFGSLPIGRFYDIGYRALLSTGSGTGRQHARQGCRRKNTCWLGQLKLDLNDFYPSMNQPNNKQLLKLPRNSYQLHVSHFLSAWLKALQAAHKKQKPGL